MYVMRVCMYVCVYVCMYVHMYVCMCSLGTVFGLGCHSLRAVASVQCSLLQHIQFMLFFALYLTWYNQLEFRSCMGWTCSSACSQQGIWEFPSKHTSTDRCSFSSVLERRLLQGHCARTSRVLQLAREPRRGRVCGERALQHN